ncbi:DUF3500 domain-containing protein [Marinivivus vitaminiproducens]|uniref:DUF3500 domain-containing protein n=1 Tax=Marinivivus vitaminiproducens TaxID=3035935 RepID=UPI00279E8F10|nr:DUF3500 domain-containing protein [Geminicoccaceae bacterium SCSIO 64248]
MTETGSERALAMRQAAAAWLDGLDAPKRRIALLPFLPETVANWHYVPRTRPGLPLGAMTEAEQAGVWRLLEAFLSEQGLQRARDQLRLETVLGVIEGRPEFRDPGNYALVLYGVPSEREPWGWRFEGHHLSLSAVVVPGQGVAVTPVFFGANPGRVPHGHRHSGFRLLGEEEDRAFALLGSLSGPQRDRVIIGNRTLGDIVSGPGREASLHRYEGAALSELGDLQRDGIVRLVELYAARLRPELAEPALDRVRNAGIGGLHFAWAGSEQPGRPHYFRIHGPALLFEYDNTQNGANHVHTVWHDPKRNFGVDLLRAHHEASHS